MERSDPVAPHDGVEPERHLVDQTAPRQIVGKLAATVGNQITACCSFRAATSSAGSVPRSCEFQVSGSLIVCEATYFGIGLTSSACVPSWFGQ